MSGEQAKNSICGYKGMSKKSKAVYAPGELSRIRDKLGVTDREEAKLLAERLGGEIGHERSPEEEESRQNRTRNERVNVKIGDRPSRPLRTVELPLEAEGEVKTIQKPVRGKDYDPADDPSIPLKVSYWERVKMDRFAGQSEFEIKSPTQVLQSVLSMFSDIPDYVSQTFVNNRMAEYYKKIEMLVISTRNMLPRNNVMRNEQMKKASPLTYAILDVIRYWEIEKISSDLVRIQSRPKNSLAGDFSDILRAIYRPLFLLELLEMEAHIRGAYKILYKLLYLENSTEAKEKHQYQIRNALTAFSGVRRDVRYLLYPLLMKIVSSNFLPYETFFDARKNRIMAFLNVSEDKRINPEVFAMMAEAKNSESQDTETEEEKQEEDGAEPGKEEPSAEEKNRQSSVEAEKKALERGLHTLEVLFPKAGWNNIESYPDLYPYFADMFDLKKGFVNIAPADPMHQIIILMRILEELFFGLRFVKFVSVSGSLTGDAEPLDTTLGEIIDSWQYYLQVSLDKEYLPRLSNYVRILEGSVEERTSVYTKKLIAELQWIKRLFFLPYYKFETFGGPPFPKGDTTPVYVKVKTLRKSLTSVAAGIDQGNKSGGADARAHCDGIENPWDQYQFQIPNPLSKRLDAFLGPKTKNNASLVYFCLAVSTVLDNLMNNEDSWAYSSSSPLFRSENGEGVKPLTGVSERVDANALFRNSLRERQKKQ